MNSYYSTHRITDGKWEVVVWIFEAEDFKHNPIQRPDLRALIDQHYNCEPLEMAKVILENVLHCERVQVNTLQGNGVYVEK